MKIVTRYVLSQIIEPFFLALVAFTSVLLVDRVFLLTKHFVEKGISPWYMLLMILYYSPAALVLTVPMAFLVGIVTAFGRLAENNEIVAIKTAGIGTHKLIIPVVIVSFLLSVFMVFFMDFGIPKGNKAYTNLYTELRRKHPALVLEPDTIMEEMSTQGRKWYFRSMDEESHTLDSVRIWERSNVSPNLITAKRGQLDFYSHWTALNLYDGTMYQSDPKDPFRGNVSVNFSQDRIILNIGKALENDTNVSQGPRNMSIKEVRAGLKRLYEENASPVTKDYIKEYNTKQLIPEYRVELYKKISIPFANLAFGLIGVPLGLIVRRGGRMVGLGVGVALIIFYYVILTAGEKLAKTGSIQPFLGAWTPNIITGIIGIILIIRTVREVPLRSMKLINMLFPSDSGNTSDEDLNKIRRK